MKILYAVHGYKPAYKIGGPIHSVSAVAERLVRKGHEVTVFTTNSNLDEDLDVPTNQAVYVDGVQVWYFNHREPMQKWLPFVSYLSKSIGFLYAPGMKTELERTVPSMDVVHTQMPFVYPTYAAGKTAIVHHKPFYYQQRGVFDPERLKFRGLKKKLYIRFVELPLMQKATKLIALTEAEVNSYRALGVRTPCHIISNGIDVEDYSRTLEDSASSFFNISPDEIIILFMARLHPMKGADRLIQAFLMIQSKFPKAKLIMAGPDEWKIVNKFRQEIMSAGIGDRVLFPGMVTGAIKQALLERANLFCLPSDAEGFSMAILEAMANKTAVLISPGCHFPDVESANAGQVVLPSVDALTIALSSLLANEAQLKVMGENGYRLVKSKYNWDTIVDSLLSIYADGISRVKARD
jgi:glycosyltransferase involved in cell wall biosynthesis